MNTYDIKTISGDSFELNMIYKDSSGVPIDLTNYEVYFQTRKSQDSEDIEFDKTFVIPLEEGELGQIKFVLTAQETELLSQCYPSSKYVYGMRLTSPSGLDIKTLLAGTLEVVRGVI